MPRAKVLERKVFYAGQCIFKEDEAGDRAFLIQDGEVDITKNGVLLGTLGKGEMFGEMALIDDEPRMATATAKGDVSVVIIGREAFREKLAKADPFIRGLLAIFVRNIRNLTR